MMVPWEADSGAASPGAARPSGAVSENPSIQPTGDVRPASCARNQACEPRRRRQARPPAQDTRGKGTRSPSGKERR